MPIINSNRNTVITVRGEDGQPATYEMQNAPAHVLHAVRLITDRWGTMLNSPTTMPKGVMHKARLLAEKWGAPYGGFTG